MRVAIKFFLVLIPAIAVVALVSIKITQKFQAQWVQGDLSRRALLISESTQDFLIRNIRFKKIGAVTQLIDRISRDERLTGAMVCGTEGSTIARSQALPAQLTCRDAWKFAFNRAGTIITVDGVEFHQAVFPISDGGLLLGYLVVLHDTAYMARRLRTTLQYVGGLVGALSIGFLLLTWLVYRWTRSDSLIRIKGMFREILRGEETGVPTTRSSEFSPLDGDLNQIVLELRNAKALAKDVETGLTWTPSRLRNEVQKVFGDTQLCVIANREPYVHNRKGTGIEVLLPASGLVTAVEPIVRACSGLWIAHGSGTADRETADRDGKLLVPPGQPEYGLKRVWLTPQQEQGYYYGFSNEGLWPLCHIAHHRPSFELQDYEAYRDVNEKFARAFLDEHKASNPIALIQDYHFALLPGMIRARKPNAILSLFWHIPWPNPEAFGICPWHKELLQGMLGADLIGFHTQFHCNNFLDSVDRFLEARVDREHFSVTIQGHVCYVKPFSISVE